MTTAFDHRTATPERVAEVESLWRLWYASDRDMMKYRSRRDDPGDLLFDQALTRFLYARGRLERLGAWR